MNPTIKNMSVNFGLYIGGALGLLTILAYAINLELFAKWWFGVILLVGMIAAGAFVIIKAKQAQHGFITFKDAFTYYFIAIVIAIIISGAISVILFNFIDPEAALDLKDKILEVQVESMRKWKAPEESITQFVSEMEKQGNMYSIGNILKSTAYQIVGYSVVGLILSLILKKNPETNTF